MRNDVLNYLELIKDEIGLLNKSELARRLNCDPRTIERYIKNPNTESRKPREIKSKIDDFKEKIIDKVDTLGSNSMSIFKYIQQKGYDGGYHTVNNFIKNYKSEQLQRATMRFDKGLGLQAKVDCKETLTMINSEGEIFNINVFLILLGYSRLSYIKLITDKTQKTLLQCLIESFKYFEGVPKEIIIDNIPAVVDRRKTTFENVAIHENFERFSKNAGFEVIAFNPYMPDIKEKPETFDKLINRLNPYNKKFDTFDDLNNIVTKFNDEINNEISDVTNEIPVARYLKEKSYLNPLPPINILL